MSHDGSEERIRLLRSLAFHVHKKVPAAEALAECFESEGRGGRHRQWRQAGEVLKADGFVAALAAAGLIGAEAAAILAVVADGGDHRLLSASLAALADHHQTCG